MDLPQNLIESLQSAARALGLLDDSGEQLAPGAVPPAPLPEQRQQEIERAIYHGAVRAQATNLARDPAQNLLLNTQAFLADLEEQEYKAALYAIIREQASPNLPWRTSGSSKSVVTQPTLMSLKPGDAVVPLGANGLPKLKSLADIHNPRGMGAGAPLGLAGIPALARGGIARQHMLGFVGEAGPEMIVPGGLKGLAKARARGRALEAAARMGALPHLAGGMVTVTNPAYKMMRKLFGHTLADADLAAMASAPAGIDVGINTTHNRLWPALQLHGYGAMNFKTLRQIYKPWFGPLTAYNELNYPGQKYKGFGLPIFNRQVEALATAGVERILTHGSGLPGNTGHIAWPRMGFGGPMSARQIARLPGDLQSALGDKRDVLDLLAIPGGSEAWRRHGSDIDLSFDLAAGSRNRLALDQYKAMRLAAGMPQLADMPHLADGGKMPNIFRPSRARMVFHGRGAQSAIEEVIAGSFGHAFDVANIPSIIGAPDNATVAVREFGGSIFTETEAPGLRASRTLRRNHHGPKITNGGFYIDKALQGKGLGLTSFAKEVNFAGRHGFKNISTTAMGSPDEKESIGSWAWARMGYGHDTGLTHLFQYNQRALNELGALFPRASTLLDLMQTEQGRAWWRNNRTDFNGNFDLSKGSMSRINLLNYLHEKQPHVTDYLSKTLGVKFPIYSAEPGGGKMPHLAGGGIGSLASLASILPAMLMYKAATSAEWLAGLFTKRPGTPPSIMNRHESQIAAARAAYLMQLAKTGTGTLPAMLEKERQRADALALARARLPHLADGATVPFGNAGFDDPDFDAMVHARQEGDRPRTAELNSITPKDMADINAGIRQNLARPSIHAEGISDPDFIADFDRIKKMVDAERASAADVREGLPVDLFARTRRLPHLADGYGGPAMIPGPSGGIMALYGEAGAELVTGPLGSKVVRTPTVGEVGGREGASMVMPLHADGSWKKSIGQLQGLPHLAGGHLAGHLAGGIVTSTLEEMPEELDAFDKARERRFNAAVERRRNAQRAAAIPPAPPPAVAAPLATVGPNINAPAAPLASLVPIAPAGAPMAIPLNQQTGQPLTVNAATVNVNAAGGAGKPPQGPPREDWPEDWRTPPFWNDQPPAPGGGVPPAGGTGGTGEKKKEESTRKQISGIRELVSVMSKLANTSTVAFGAAAVGLSAMAKAAQPAVWQTFEKSMLMLSANIGGVLIEPMVKLIHFTNSLTDAWKDLSEGVKHSITHWVTWGMGGLGAAMIMGRVASAASTVLPVLSALKHAMVFTMTNPFGMLVVGLAALAVASPQAFAPLKEAFIEIGPLAKEALKGILPMVGSIAGAMAQALVPAIRVIADTLVMVAPLLKDTFLAMKEPLTMVAGVLGTAFTTGVKLAAGAIYYLMEGANAIGAAFGTTGAKVIALGATFFVLVGPISSIITGLVAARAAMISFTVATATNPIGLIAVGLAAAATAALAFGGAFGTIGTQLRDSEEQLRKLHELLEKLKRGEMPKFDEVTERLSPERKIAYGAAKDDNARDEILKAQMEEIKRNHGLGLATEDKVKAAQVGIEGHLGKFMPGRDIPFAARFLPGADIARNTLAIQDAHAREKARRADINKALADAGLSPGATALAMKTLDNPGVKDKLGAAQVSEEDRKAIAALVVKTALDAAVDVQVLQKAIGGNIAGAGQGQALGAGEKQAKLAQGGQELKNKYGLIRPRDYEAQTMRVEDVRSYHQNQALNKDRYDLEIMKATRAHWLHALDADKDRDRHFEMFMKNFEELKRGLTG